MAAESDFITACETGNVEAVTKILENEVVSDDQLQKGLSKAAWGSHPAVADILLSKGANVDRSSFVGSASRGYSTMFELFVKYGFDINTTEFEDGTALRMSVGNENLTRWLLAHGADPNVSHDRAPSPLISAAVTEKGYGAMRLLLEHGAALEPNILH
ncbi:ankyrin, partial [Neurospora tetrasperma FGSC 2509]